MTTFGEVTARLSAAVPLSLAEEWDNPGPQAGSLRHNIGRVLVAVDLDRAVLDEAVAYRADLILTHHPLVFKPIRNLVDDDPAKVFLRELVRRDIAVYAMHTNLDRKLRFTLARTLGVKKPKPFDPPSSHGSWGRLDRPLRFDAFLDRVRTRLGCANPRIAGPAPKRVVTAAFCGGSGSFLIGPRLTALGVDLFLTADLKYHDAQKASQIGLCVVDAGHFQTERVMLPEMAALVRRLLPGAAVKLSGSVGDPFQSNRKERRSHER